MSDPVNGPRYWGQMTERAVNERREAARECIFLGDHYQFGYPLLPPLSMWERHGLIYGPPGSGKSVLAAQLVLQFLAYFYNVVVIDCKGSFVFLNNVLDFLKHTADAAGRLTHDIRVFNPFSGYPSHIYNPLRQKVWRDAPSHIRAETLNEAAGIRGAEGTNTAFFAAMSFLCSADLVRWFPDMRSALEFFSIINDRELFGAKGGNLNDWNHSRHLAAALRQIAECGPPNATPKALQQEIELTDLFTSTRPQLQYFFLSAVADQGTSALIGRILLQQIKRAAFSSRPHWNGRKTIIVCDEAQQLFGPMFGDVLEQLREFGVSLLMLHQSRGQLVTPLADFRERFENAIGVQICLGARTPDEIKYLSDTDGERIEYGLGWTQPITGVGEKVMLHPRLSYQQNPWSDPQLINASERVVPKLGRETILNVSSDPQAGFIRGFLNEKLWAFNGSWVPFQWFHHLTFDEFRRFGKTYPEPLPGQDVYTSTIDPTDTPSDSYSSLTTNADVTEVTKALRDIISKHPGKANSRLPKTPPGDSSNGQS